MNFTRVAAEPANPAAASVIADTGALTPGVYRVVVRTSAADVVAAGRGVAIEHRNAANNGNVYREFVLAGTNHTREFSRLVVANNERVRVVMGAVAASGAAAVYGASIEYVQIG